MKFTRQNQYTELRKIRRSIWNRSFTRKSSLYAKTLNHFGSFTQEFSWIRKFLLGFACQLATALFRIIPPRPIRYFTNDHLIPEKGRPTAVLAHTLRTCPCTEIGWPNNKVRSGFSFVSLSEVAWHKAQLEKKGERVWGKKNLHSNSSLQDLFSHTDQSRERNFIAHEKAKLETKDLLSN